MLSLLANNEEKSSSNIKVLTKLGQQYVWQSCMLKIAFNIANAEIYLKFSTYFMHASSEGSRLPEASLH